MGDKTAIEWTDATWNPVTGCTKVSPGCDHCYAETLAERFRGTPGHYFEQGFDVQLRPDKLDQPLRWRRPRRVFVNSMSDLFHKDIPDEYIARVWAVMAYAHTHTFQVLTKRPARMRSLLTSKNFERLFDIEYCRIPDWNNTWPNLECTPPGHISHLIDGPLSNVWLGVSAEDQKWADIRIPQLLTTPAAVRFISAEPLLGPIDLSGDLVTAGGSDRIDWVIVGGESGHGARPMHPDWVRTLRDQCVKDNVPFHFKQWGQWVTEAQAPDDIILPGTSRWREFGTDDGPSVYKVGKTAAGRELDGRTWDEAPAAHS